MDSPIPRCLGRQKDPGSKTRNQQMEIGTGYRYLNSCLEGHEFPLPVMEDLLQGQA